MNKWIKTATALGLLMVGSGAYACALTAWSGQGFVRGGVQTVSPNSTDADASGPRVGGACAVLIDGDEKLENLGPTQGPTSESRLIARFYFLANGSGSATIFEAYSDEGADVNTEPQTSVFSVSYDGTNVTVTPAGGGSISAPVDASRAWHSVEVDWDSTTPQLRLWVDANAAAGDPASATSNDAGTGTSIESVQLGAINGLGGFGSLLFDDYESRRTTAIGELCPGDIQGASAGSAPDGTRDLGDVLELFDEASTFGANLNTQGVSDFDLNGSVDLGDVLDLFAIVSVFQGDCP